MVAKFDALHAQSPCVKYIERLFAGAITIARRYYLRCTLWLFVL